MNARRYDLTAGSVAGALTGLTAPLMLGFVSMILAQVADIWFVGQLGTRELVAISFTFPVVMALNSISLGISIGCSSIISRRIGAGKRDEAQRIASHGLVLVFCLMLAGAMAGLATIDPLFTALGAEPETLVLIHNYLDVYYPGVAIMTLAMVASNLQRSAGNARVPAALMIAGSLLHVALTPALIFGLVGLPRLELAGAALAAILARSITIVISFYYLAFRERLLTLQGWQLQQVLASWREILTIGLPATATQLIGPVSTAIITAMLAKHGEVVVAGFGVATRVESVAVMMLFALSASIGPFVGQNWGADRQDRVAEGLRLSYLFCLIWGSVMGLAMLISGSMLVTFFDDDPTVIASASAYLLIVPFSYGPWGVLMIASATFNALGRPLPSTAMSAIRMFALYIPLAMLGEWLWGYRGIFLASALANGIMGTVGWLWLRSHLRAQSQLAESAATTEGDN